MFASCLEAWADNEPGIDKRAAIVVVAETLFHIRNFLTKSK